jgi:hypothetical protein
LCQLPDTLGGVSLHGSAHVSGAALSSASYEIQVRTRDRLVGEVQHSALAMVQKNLIEERAFAVVPVPRLLPDLLGTGQSSPGPVARPPSLLVIGDVDFDAAPGKLDLRIAESPGSAVVIGTAPLNRAGALGQWSRLPGAGAESAAIQKLFRQRFPDAAFTELTGSQATEGTLRTDAPRHRYLHFATHGFFAPASLKSILATASRPQRNDAIWVARPAASLPGCGSQDGDGQLVEGPR